MKKIWFKAKEYGWGWYPVTWQGWLVTLVFIVLLLLNSWRIDSSSPSDREALTGFLPQTLFLVILLLYICYKTGGKPRWRWGGKDLTGKK